MVEFDCVFDLWVIERSRPATRPGDSQTAPIQVFDPSAGAFGKPRPAEDRLHQARQFIELFYSEQPEDADEVVRLPEGFAIEKAIVHGIGHDVLVAVLTELNRAWQLNLRDLQSAGDKDLRATAVRVLKQKSGLHAQYVELLPVSSPPSVALALLGAISDLARGTRAGPCTLQP